MFREILHHIRCKYAGIKGFLTAHQDGLKCWYVLTAKAKAGIEKGEG